MGGGGIILSLLKLGDFNDLRIYTIILVIFMYILTYKRNYVSLLSKFNQFINGCCTTKVSKFIFIIFIFLVLMQAARTNVTYDADSRWYGLRPEQVLVGENSFFDYLGLSAFVFYYPKLMEFLFLPLSNIGDFSFIQIQNCFVLIFLSIALFKCIYVLLESVKAVESSDQSLKKIKKTYQFPLTLSLVLVSIPTVSNMASTAKPDILASFLVIAGFYYFVCFIIKNNFKFVLLSLTALFLSTAVKHTSYLFGGVIFISSMLVIIFMIINKRVNLRKVMSVRDSGYNKAPIMIVICGFVTALGMYLRTFLLTGYPIYPITLGFWNKLGFTAKKFFKSDYEMLVDDFSFVKLFERLYKFVLDPHDLGHVYMLWTSSLFIFLLIVALVYFKKKNISKLNYLNVFLISTLVLLVTVMLYYMSVSFTPDGNYFIVPILVISIVLIYYIFKNLILEPKIGVKACYIIFTIMFLLMHFPIMIVSHPSWTVGYRGGGFKRDIIVDNFESGKELDKGRAYAGYSKIYDYLIQYNYNDVKILVSGYGLPHLPDGVYSENAEGLNSYFSSQEITASYEGFESYINETDIVAFILFDDVDSIRHYADEYLNKNSYYYSFEDEKATFYLLRDISNEGEK